MIGYKVEPIPEGYAQLTKSVTISNSQKSFDSNAVNRAAGTYKYYIYDSNNTKLSETFTVSIPSGSTSAKSNTVKLDAGSYYAVEYQTPNKVLVDGTKIPFTVTASNTSTKPAAVSQNNILQRLVYVEKTSSNSALTNGNSCYNMNGIKYNIYDNEACTGTPVATLTLSGYNRNTSTATSSAVYLANGTYWVIEDKNSVSGTGFRHSTTKRRVNISSTSPDVTKVSFSNAPTNDPNALKIYKGSSSEENKRIEDVSATFKVEYFPNANWSGTPTRTWYYKTINAECLIDNERYLDTSYSNSERFKDGNNVVLPLGTIRVTEAKAPTGYYKSDFILRGKIELNSSNVATFSWSTNEEVAKLFYESDGTPSYLDRAIPTLKTLSADINTLDHVGTYGETEIKDTVTYQFLEDGKTYVFVATLRDNETGEQVGEPSEKTVIADSSVTEVTEINGEIRVPLSSDLEMPAISVDTRDYEDKTLVITEVLYELDGDTRKEITAHNNLLDEDQSTHIIKVTTTAKDGKTGVNTGTVGAKEKVIDKVVITNAIIGQEYVVKGTFVYTEDCVDRNGKEHKKGEVIAEHDEVTVVAESETIELELTFEVDSSALAGLSAVVFEDIYHNDVLVGVHHDYEAPEQTIDYPEVRTTATDKDTEIHTGLITEIATIVDVVDISNVRVGDKLKLRGKVINSDGTDYLENGEPIIVETEEFIAEETSFKKNIEFILDSTLLKGKSIVIAETLILITDEGETEVSEHNDPTDEGQTVYYPDGRTEARDKETGIQITKLDNEAVVVDTFFYEGLAPNVEYTLKGKLMDKTDPENIVEVSSNEITFVPKKPNDFVEIEFTFKAEEGHTYVAFENLFYKDFELVKHENPEDKDQTITVPKFWTIGELANTEIDIVNRKYRIRDHAYFENLEEGTYIMKGRLINKATGEETFVSGSHNETTFEVTSERSGIISIDFELDAKENLGITYVIYERLYKVEDDGTEVLVVAHEDINNLDQTVHVPRGAMTFMFNGKVVPTGDENNIGLHFMLGLTAFLLLFIMIRKKRSITKRTILPILLIVFLSTSLSFGASELVKETTYYSNTSDAPYEEAEEKIVEDGVEYILKDITYEVLAEKSDFSETFSVEKGELPEKQEFTINGEKVELLLDKGTVKNNEPLIMEKEFIDTEDLPEEFGFLIDGKNYTGTLKSYETFDRGEAFSVQGVYKGEIGSEYVDIGGILYPLNTERPVFEGYQEYLKSILGMTDNYTINNAYWVNESINDGIVTKTASYDGIRSYHDYLCEYEIEGATGQTGTYTNSGLPSSKYEIKATLIYEPAIKERNKLSAIQKAVLTGVSILGAAAICAGILFATKKKREEDN